MRGLLDAHIAVTTMLVLLSAAGSASAQGAGAPPRLETGARVGAVAAADFPRLTCW